MRVTTIISGVDLKITDQIKTSFRKNGKLYLQEALGLGIFMISACFFGALLESRQSSLHHAIPEVQVRTIIMGIAMGFTALFIFYSPFTSPSGSQINPAVTISFWRLGKMEPWDAVFYIFFQFIGGTIAVFIMQVLVGQLLTNPPVRFAVTVPGNWGVWPAMLVELIISFITMSVVLFTSSHQKLKKYTRLISAFLVCSWVIVAGPISGFGMNPARSFASAFQAHHWKAFWIYVLMPVAGMLLATEFFIYTRRKSKGSSQFISENNNQAHKKFIDPLEFVL